MKICQEILMMKYNVLRKNWRNEKNKQTNKQTQEEVNK